MDDTAKREPEAEIEAVDWILANLDLKPSNPVEAIYDRMEAIDELLCPLVAIVVTMEAPVTCEPGEWDHWIRATK